VRGYPDGLPDGEEVPIKLENARKVPSWRRVCKTLLKNDYWCKYLDFSPTKTAAYAKYEAIMKKRRLAWGIFTEGTA
jgi:predicted phosphoadenosine phosphosulfate sulfurtransferase